MLPEGLTKEELLELHQESKAEEAQEQRKLQEREERRNPKKFTGRA